MQVFFSQLKQSPNDDGSQTATWIGFSFLQFIFMFVCYSVQVDKHPHSDSFIKAIWSVHICPTLVINASAAARITNIGLVSHFSHVPQHQLLYHEFNGGRQRAVEHGISAGQMLVCEPFNDDFS